MTWIYNCKPFTSEDIGECFGFVYEIINNETGRRYIGQKKFYFKKIIPATKTRKKKRVLVESDWQEYYSSSLELQEDVKQLGPEKFTRTIIRLCKSKSEMSYYELREQLVNDVLLYPDKYYNSYIGGRINRQHLVKKIPK